MDRVGRRGARSSSVLRCEGCNMFHCREELGSRATGNTRCGMGRRWKSRVGSGTHLFVFLWKLRKRWTIRHNHVPLPISPKSGFGISNHGNINQVRLFIVRDTEVSTMAWVALLLKEGRLFQINTTLTLYPQRFLSSCSLSADHCRRECANEARLRRWVQRKFSSTRM